MIELEDLQAGFALLCALPAFLWSPVHATEAKAVVRQRMVRRPRHFLELVKAAVFDNPTSAYRPLLRHSGCEFGDLAGLVDQEGVEGALSALFRAGVYLTVEEFKGRRPVVRGGSTLPFDPRRAANPRASPHVPMRSSGSRGVRPSILFDLAYIRDCAIDRCLAYDAWGGPEWVKAVWVIPGGSGMVDVLEHTLESRPARWFSHVDPAAPGVEARYRWGVRALRWGSVIASRPLPQPHHVSVHDPAPVVDWITEVLSSGRRPLLYTFASSAVQVCQAALDRGIHLGGAAFDLMGEPVTAARLAVVHRAGARGLVDYGASETGSVAFGCLAPDAPDDVHFCRDLLAVIQLGPSGSAVGLPADTLLFSTLRPQAPVIMLNVSLGDRAWLGDRDCGCALADLGWTTHLRSVGSFEKLTAAGMTFLDVDVIRILEEVLPARFGGIPTDYQLIEAEGRQGRPEIRLVVHPRVGPVDPAAIIDTFLTALGQGSGAERVMVLMWRDAGVVQVERGLPHTTPSGKILHLHQAPRPALLTSGAPGSDSPSHQHR
jgi:hypothetical protein